MSDLSARSWIFLAAASVLDVLTARGIGPFTWVAGLVLLLGCLLPEEWFAAGLAAAWVLLSAPLLVAFGAPETTRNRVAVLFLALMAATLVRMILEARKPAHPPPSRWTGGASSSGQWSWR